MRVARKTHRKANKEVGRKFIKKYKRKNKCEKCGAKNDLTFHHCNPSKKKDNVSNMVRRGLPLEEIKKEVRKCVVLCVVCHRQEHA